MCNVLLSQPNLDNELKSELIKLLNVLFSVINNSISFKSDKKWIIDLDKELFEYQDLIMNTIIELHSKIKNGNCKIYCIIPTFTGKHIITTPFDILKFNEVMRQNGVPTENLVQKDSPTLLYYSKP